MRTGLLFTLFSGQDALSFMFMHHLLLTERVPIECPPVSLRKCYVSRELQLFVVVKSLCNVENLMYVDICPQRQHK